MVKVDYNLIKNKADLIEYFKSKFINYTLIGKKIKQGVIKKIINKKTIELNSGEVVELINKDLIYDFNPITNKYEFMPIMKLILNGYYLNANLYKKIYYKTDEYKQKLKETHIKNFGSQENYIKIWKEKVNKTNKDKYGVNWFLERGEHYNKIDKVMLDKYGVKTPILNDEIKAQITKSIKERFGVEWFFNRGEHYDKVESIMLDKYGVKNNFHLISKNSGSVSKLEKRIIEEIISCNNLDENEISFYKNKQKTVKVNDAIYNVDFYHKRLNIVIEIYGDLWHCNPNLYDKDYINKSYKLTAKEVWEKDKVRKQLVEKELKCTFVIVWENDWKNNKKETLENIKNIFKNAKNNKETL